MKQKIGVVSVVLIVALMVLAFFLGERPLQNYPDYSTESPAPTGIKAFVALLGKYYDRVEIWQEKGKMPEGTSHLVILVEPGILGRPGEPGGRFLTEEEEELWIDWMERGNSLWLMGQYPAEICSLWSEYGVKKAEKSEGDWGSGTSGTHGVSSEEEEAQVQGGDGLTGLYRASLESSVRLEPQPDDIRLLWDDLGFVCLARSYGTGELMALNAPEWLQNEHILKGDRVQILMRLLNRSAPQDIWFYGEGSQQQRSVWSVIPVGVYYVAALFLVTILLELWRRGMRFGVAEVPREGAVRFGDERIQALGSWYHRQGFYTEALGVQICYLKQKMFEVWGITDGRDESKLRRILQGRMKSQEVEKWIRDYQWIRDKKGSDKMSQREYIMWSQRLSRMQQEVQS